MIKVYIVRGNRIQTNWIFSRYDCAYHFTKEYVKRRVECDTARRVEQRVRARSF
jgi:hypothetical protein